MSHQSDFGLILYDTKEASDFLAKLGFPASTSRLTKLRMSGDGPEFRRLISSGQIRGSGADRMGASASERPVAVDKRSSGVRGATAMSAENPSPNDDEAAPLSPDDTAALAQMTPEELDAYRKEASACAALGVRLTPAAWSTSETFGKALALLRCLPAAPFWTPAHKDLVRAIVAVWPALAPPADEFVEEGEFWRDAARNPKGFALGCTWPRSRPDARQGAHCEDG